MIVPDRPSLKNTAPDQHDSGSSMADPFPSSTPPPYTESPLSEKGTLEPYKDTFDALALAPPPPSPASLPYDREDDSGEDFIGHWGMHNRSHLLTPRSTFFINTALFALALVLIQLTVVLPYLVWSYFIGFSTEHGLRTTREVCLLSSWLSCLLFCITVLYRWTCERLSSNAPVFRDLGLGSIPAFESEQRMLESYTRRLNPPLTLREATLKSFMLVVFAWLVVTGMVTGTCVVLVISEAGWRLVGIL